MRKKTIIILGIILIIFLMIPLKSEEFRIRVIASSDSNYDQKIKMRVVEEVKKELSTYNKEKMEKEVRAHLTNIEQIVAHTLNNYYDHPSYVVEIRDEVFPPKELEGKVVAGGAYKTLVISIEEGKGKNWWTLLYPEYYQVSFEDVQSREVEVRFFLLDKIKQIFK